MNEIAVSEQPSLSPQNFDEALRFSQMLAKSGMVPKNFRGKPDDILIAIQMGAELGLKPMQAIQNIAVVNERPALWGDAVLAICRKSPLCESISETFDEKTMTATCTARRKGEPNPFISVYTQQDAEKALLWKKPGSWQTNPKRMLKLRARGFALRDAFADLLRGINIAEEVNDIPKGAEEKPLSDIIDIEKPIAIEEPKFLSGHKHWAVMVDYFEAKPENLEKITRKKSLEELATVEYRHFDYIWQKIQNAEKI